MDLQEVSLSELESVEGGGGTDAGTSHDACMKECRSAGLSERTCERQCKNS
jgi:hypothetical protein